MALQSMTGFARVDGSCEAYRWAWEIKTVNGKGLDIRLRLPPGFDAMDRDIRNSIAKKLHRGSCFATLTLKRDCASTSVQINEDVLASVLSCLEELSERIDAQKPSMDGILGFRGVLETVELEDDETARQALVTALNASFVHVVSELASAREAEGAALRTLLEGHLDTISELTLKAEACPARQPDAIKLKLRENIERLLDNGSGFDEERLHTEALLLAAKADIREELDRLNAHVDAGKTLLASGDVIGRKLDFLAQEFNRETNTLCSKSNDRRLTAIGLDLKATVDQLREQIQNLE